jgi:hypothetical protein
MGRCNNHGSLYASFCDHFSNEAVLDMKPLGSLQRNSSFPWKTIVLVPPLSFAPL